MVKNINPHQNSLHKINEFMNNVEKRIEREADGDEKSDINREDVRQWNQFKDALGKEASFLDVVQQMINRADGDDGVFIPFQPAALAADGTISMPSEFVRGPGDVVALYVARPDPVYQRKAELLIKFDTMLLEAASQLEGSVGKLKHLVIREANDDRALSLDEIKQVRIILEGIEAGVESLADVMEYRKALAAELQNHEEPKEGAQGLVDRLTKIVNEKDNDLNVMSGWNPSMVLYHADRLANDEVLQLIGAMKGDAKLTDPVRKEALEILFKNAGDSIAPLIIAKNGADHLTKYATSLGLDLDFATVADKQKSHPLG